MPTRANNVQNPLKLTAAGSALQKREPSQVLATISVEARESGPPHLINSKLKPPLPAAACIARQPLIAQMDSAARRKLVLLAAPIGSGKTTLLTQWYRRAAADRSVAWLSLDEADNDPVRFFSYLIGAVRNTISAFDAYMPGRHDAQEAMPLEPVVAHLSESFGRLGQELAIVLDDFQCLSTPSLVHAFELLLHGSPDSIHWVISGRCVPELNLAHFRLNDQLVTLDAAELHFDSTLIVQLSRKLCRRPLSRTEADCIRSRTEGWVAGVKLALLATAESGISDEALQQFAGSHCEVARYLGASVLQEQSAEIREFLIASSIVDRMTGELCNALLGISHSQLLLERLERSQLFIQPLDSHAHWYRYHTLFLDFLRSRLRRDAAARIPILHERASRWFAEHQLYEEALHHAFAASNAEWRCELVARCAGMWLQNGEIADVIRWCEKLPRPEAIGRADICTPYISSLILSRRFDDAAAALRHVKTCAAADRAVGSVQLRMLHMMLTILSNSSSEMSFASHDSLRSAGADRFLSGTLLTLQAYAMLRQNQFEIAWRLAMRARDTLENISVYGFGYADVVALLAERAQGDMKSAIERCERMFAMVRGGRRNPAWVNAATALAHMRYEENRLAEAEDLCTEVLPLLSVASTIENLTSAYITLARIKAINDRVGDAFQLLGYLHSVLESGCHERFLARVCGEKIRLCLLQNQVHRARAIAQDFGLPKLAESGEWKAPRPYDEAWERFGLAHASVLLQEKEYGECLAILTVLRDSAHDVGYVYREVSLEAALAECYWRAGDSDSAFEALNRALALTRGYGFTRGVFDDVPTLNELIAAALKQHKLRHVLPRRYLCKFENILSDRTGAASTGAQKRKPALPLEPLTDRELDMLKLLARGLSNLEISEHSRIALSTAKWHLKNVFAKLDVNTRTGAIARARELQLI